MSTIKTSAQIREAFLKFFEEQSHKRVASSSLVPGNDQTLLFTNAGMVQFKDVFLGFESPGYTRATTSQRCVRAGGKHNDLDNVGYTARHHTFFEMLGNFSFGDYFKREAIQFAWTFLTTVLQLPAEKLWVTVFEEDSEAADIWLKEMKIDPTRFSYCGKDDNFWSMGDTGPCGPCTEIFYDHGPDVPGGPPGSEGSELDRYIEIWNLVFMQYNRDTTGSLTPLPKPSVDTGMGLERICAVMQGVHSNYDIDIFKHIIDAIKSLLPKGNAEQTSIQVIADHIRSCAFLIVDGVLPSNEGRGYVLRRIIRRAIRHGHKLGLESPFFFKLVQPLIDMMGQAYPELKQAKSRVEETLLKEENQFSKTLANGMSLLEEVIASLKNKTLPGELIFKLYDTYGFPVDLTNDIAREKGLTLDEAGFEEAMARQQALSKRADHFSAKNTVTLQLDKASEFLGYDTCYVETIIAACVNEHHDRVDVLKAGEKGILVLAQTPFYAESGGQIGDVGKIKNAHALFEVQDTQKQGQYILHHGFLKTGTLKLHDQVDACVDEVARQKTALNHSATHLLHEALRQVLGDHVMQRGSLVTPDKLRLDFSHPDSLTPVQWEAIETTVNLEIRKNHCVKTDLMDLEAAKATGAMALFGEKYADLVRVLKMGDFSIELCGGTHASRTGDIGYFTLLSEASVASGVRRIEAVTGEKAVFQALLHKTQLDELARLLKTHPADLLPKLQQVFDKQQQLEKRLHTLEKQIQKELKTDWASDVKQIAEINLLVKQLPDSVAVSSLRDLLDQAKDSIKSGVIVLALVSDGKVNLIAGVTKDLVTRFSAGALIQFLSAKLDGRGGGRADMAQGAGSDVSALKDALESIPHWISEQ
jgi:alanyl-tRNA synthetase